MLVTNHVLSGAVVGAALRNPIPAFAVGVASHFALDSVPHWGQWDSDQQFFRVAVIDGLTGLTTMAAMTRLARRNGTPWLALSVLAGMAGAALPDLDKPAKILLGHTLWPEKVNDFHHRIQDEAPHRFYSHEVVGAVTFVVGAVALIRRFAR
jgi:LexA-binding, inner membrane-associated putative hydrolase